MGLGHTDSSSCSRVIRCRNLQGLKLMCSNWVPGSLFTTSLTSRGSPAMLPSPSRLVHRVTPFLSFSFFFFSFSRFMAFYGVMAARFMKIRSLAPFLFYPLFYVLSAGAVPCFPPTSHLCFQLYSQFCFFPGHYLPLPQLSPLLPPSLFVTLQVRPFFSTLLLLWLS